MNSFKGILIWAPKVWKLVRHNNYDRGPHIFYVGHIYYRTKLPTVLLQIQFLFFSGQYQLSWSKS